MKQGVILFIIFILLVIGVRYYQIKADAEAEKADNYRKSNTLLLNQLRRVYEEKIRLQRENEILEELAKEENEVFDWNRDISNSAVIKQLQSKRGGISGNTERAGNLH